MSEPFLVTSVLFVPAPEEPRCRQHLENGNVLTLAGVAPSGKPRKCTGLVRSIKPNSILQPGYPLMVTMAEIVANDGE